MSSSTSQASSSSKTWRPSAAASAPASAPFSRPVSPSMPRPMRAPTLLPSSTASSVVRLLRWATSSSPWGSLWTARASITRIVSLARSRSSSVMISPWKLGWLNPRTSNCTGPIAMATPSLFPAWWSDRVAQLAAVGGHGPDDEDVQGDDEQRPERVVGNEGEVGDRAEHGQGDRRHPGPGPPRQQPPAGEGHQQPDQQMGPAPGGGVELEQVVAGRDIELVLEDADQPLQGLEHPGHDHHDRREQDEPDGRPARLPLGATGSGRVRVFGQLFDPSSGPRPATPAGRNGRPKPPSHQARQAASPVRDERWPHSDRVILLASRSPGRPAAAALSRRCRAAAGR